MKQAVSLSYVLVLIGIWLGPPTSPCLAQSDGSFTNSCMGCPGFTDDSGPVLYGRLPSGAWHLGGSSLIFSSDGTQWSARAGGEYLRPTSSAECLAPGDDAVIGPLALAFPFSYPGGVGTTSSIDVNTNGRIYLEAGTNSYDGGWWADQILPDFLNATPSICALGCDLNPGQSGIISFENRVIGGDEVALITWSKVPEYANPGENTFQCQLWSTGEVVLTYVEINDLNASKEALVGISAGGGASDPGASSLSVPLVLSASGIPVIGAELMLTATGVPLSATGALLLMSFDRLDPPLPIPGTPEGCELSIAAPFVWNAPMWVDAPLAQLIFPIPNETLFDGLSLECQAFVFDPTLGTPTPLIVSDRGTLNIGIAPDLVFVAEGLNSFRGSSDANGFFRLESSIVASHPPIVGLEVSFAGTPLYFDVEGNAGVDGQGNFNDGHGSGPTCASAYYGTDITTGLVYGTPFQPPSACDPSATVGWVGSQAIGGSTTRFQTLNFEFSDFRSGESFGFDCDTDGGDSHGGAQLLTVTVTFDDMTSITRTVEPVSYERAQGVIIQ